MENDNRNTEIMNLFHNGSTYKEIAQELGVSRNAVAGVVYRNRKNEPDQRKASRLSLVVSDGCEQGDVLFMAKKHGIKKAAARYRAIHNSFGWSLCSDSAPSKGENHDAK